MLHNRWIAFVSGVLVSSITIAALCYGFGLMQYFAPMTAAEHRVRVNHGKAIDETEWLRTERVKTLETLKMVRTQTAKLKKEIEVVRKELMGQ